MLSVIYSFVYSPSVVLNGPADFEPLIRGDHLRGTLNTPFLLATSRFFGRIVLLCKDKGKGGERVSKKHTGCQ